jgi:hypothetical protein
LTPEAQAGSWVELSEAIRALRTALRAAWLGGEGERIRFAVEPVELTLQAGVTRVAKGAAGIRWHVLTLGGDRSRESVSTQTLKLRLMPILLDEGGQPMPTSQQLIFGQDETFEETPRESLQEPM